MMKYGIICETEEEYMGVLNILDGRGYTWSSDLTLLHSERCWEWYTDDYDDLTCLCICDDMGIVCIDNMSEYDEVYQYDDWIAMVVV